LAAAAGAAQFPVLGTSASALIGVSNLSRMTVFQSNKHFFNEVKSGARFDSGQKKRLEIPVIDRRPIIFTCYLSWSVYQAVNTTD
jgi:hypothetical protein